MIIFPAIDILDGQCVRLIQGDYNQEKVYSDAPAEMAKEWEEKGASYIHIVDLNGAKTGDSINKNVINHIAQSTTIPVQVGGGIRSLETIQGYLENGVSRVIIGTAAITDREFLKEAIQQYGDRIVVSLDARDGFIATDGWTDTSDTKALDLVQELESLGLQTIVYTDIAKDGMLEGPNIIEQREIHQATTMQVIASGGITTTADIQALAEEKLYGAIIGKALYDGKLSLESVLEASE
ncbi:MAG TPA: 1-(5-phosphoribosyl)-5-[(5-phosphoribosylamino)methylideneamino]imidazole-4-carboxamide isomerase [Pseudogracilibacillus sp.]|nr:1-(5-phosphoribosyl)-5-[(5-phosphoribosylamino)methylideneamino]imidazole-4-carboxamide isomerase [Pseudogracilibacillus sp.]